MVNHALFRLKVTTFAMKFLECGIDRGIIVNYVVLALRSCAI